MTTLFDEEARFRALTQMAARACAEDPVLAQAMVDVGLMAYADGSRRPTTNRRTLAKAKKIVRNWHKVAQRQLDQQLATGVLDLSPEPDEIQLDLWRFAEAGATLRGELNELIETAKEVIRKGGDQPRMLVLETTDGLLGAELPDDRDRRDAVMAAILSRFEPQAFLMLFEGWTAPGSGRPSRHPERQEAIVAALHEPGSCEVTMILFRRTPAGVEFAEPETEQAESRWSELLRSGGERAVMGRG